MKKDVSEKTMLLLNTCMKKKLSWGRLRFIVDDVRWFDLCLKTQFPDIFNENVSEDCECTFAEYVKKHQKDSFRIFSADGKEYIAVPFPEFVNADNFVE